jgi:septal ring factor EnvC (AmiA/AmiB activator)
LASWLLAALLATAPATAVPNPCEPRWIGEAGTASLQAACTAHRVARQARDLASSSAPAHRNQLAARRQAVNAVHTALSRLRGYAAGPGFRRLKGGLRLPIAGRPVNAGFGERPRFSSPTVTRHTGLSFSARPNDQVVSVARGVVVAVVDLVGFGQTVVVDQGDGYTTTFAQLASVAVHPGDPVAAGTRIGRAGVDSPWGIREIYFEIRHQGLPLDPRDWFVPGSIVIPDLQPPWRRPARPRP